MNPIKRKGGLLMSTRIHNFKTALLALVIGFLPLVVRAQIVKQEGMDDSPYFFLHTGYYYNWYDAWKLFFLVLAALLLLILMILEFRKNRQAYWFPKRIIIPLGIFALALVASTALSEFPHNALFGYINRMEGFFAWAAYLVLFLAAWTLAREKDFEVWGFPALEKFYMAGAVLFASAGLLQLWGSDPLTWPVLYKGLVPAAYREALPEVVSKYPLRAYVTVSNPNYVGSWCALALPWFSMGFLASDEKTGRSRLCAFLVFLLTALLMGSRSRAGMVGVLAALGLVFLLDIRNLKKTWKRWGLLLAASGAGMLFLELTTGGLLTAWLAAMGGRFVWLKTIFPSAFKQEGLEGATAGRLGSGRGLIWSLSFPLMKKTWLLGNGPDTYVFYYPHRESFAGGFTKFAAKPHSLYLLLFINQGGTALAAFLALAGSVLAKAKSVLEGNLLKPFETALAASVLAYLVTGLFNDSVLSSAPLFWIFLGLLGGRVFRQMPSEGK